MNRHTCIDILLHFNSNEIRLWKLCYLLSNKIIHGNTLQATTHFRTFCIFRDFPKNISHKYHRRPDSSEMELLQAIDELRTALSGGRWLLIALQCMLMSDWIGLKIPALLQIIQVSGHPRITRGLQVFDQRWAWHNITHRETTTTTVTHICTSRTAKWPSHVLASTCV